jgi:hypothetical protein
MAYMRGIHSERIPNLNHPTAKFIPHSIRNDHSQEFQIKDMPKVY